MKRNKPILFLCIILFLAAVAVAVLKREKPSLVQHLLDGSKVELFDVQSGRQFEIFGRGWPWQHLLFKLFGTNLPPRLRGHGDIYRSRFDAGSVVVRLRHSGESDFAAIPSLDLLNSSMNSFPILLDQRKASMQTNLAYEFTWEIRAATNKFFKLRYGCGSTTNAVEFTIPNPMPL